MSVTLPFTIPTLRRSLIGAVSILAIVPLLYFAAPRLFSGHSTRVVGVVPSVLRPQVLWNADMLSVSDGVVSQR